MQYLKRLRTQVAALLFALIWAGPGHTTDTPAGNTAAPAKTVSNTGTSNSSAASTQLGGVTVTANRFADAGDSATIGTVYSDELKDLPISRTGELLEVVPGLIVTQHSGEGKANQYFLRGFNLDHGTDIAITVDNVPVNLPSHAHGQGYADINFLIPELVDTIQFRKGPYYPQYGDFAAAGAVDLHYRDSFPGQTVQFTGGSFGYYRGLLAGSVPVHDDSLLYGLDVSSFNTPFQNRGAYKGTAVLRYSHDRDDGSYHITLTGYDTDFNSTDQIPERAVASGQISRFGCIDCTDGGRSYRYSLEGDDTHKLGAGVISASAYAFRYHLNLYSNFTYFFNDPVNGDQMLQSGSRNVYGGKIAYKLDTTLLSLPISNELGVQTRFDDIMPVGLFYTHAQHILSTVSLDRIQEFSISPYLQSTLSVTPWLKLQPGVRFDQYHVNVESNITQDSGAVSETLVEPKMNFILGPFYKTEFFLNLGKGFHSNDARGTTQNIIYDPRSNTRTPSTPGPLLVPAYGADLGLRTMIVPDVQTAISLFVLHLDSELVFDGDTAGSDPSRPSDRQGIETSVHWQPLERLVLDADYTYTRARFSGAQPGDGNFIAEAPSSTAEVGITYQDPLGFDGELKFRYFGRRPLTDDGSVLSHTTKIVNLGGGYHFTPALRVGVELLNIFNSRDHEIDYYYTSRLPGEPLAGVNDYHFHPVQPFEARLTVSYSY